MKVLARCSEVLARGRFSLKVPDLCQTLLAAADFFCDSLSVPNLRVIGSCKTESLVKV